MRSIVVGDMVRLKSGGPTLTVESISHGKAVCTWSDKDRNLQSKEFPIEMLVSAEMNINLDDWL